MGQDVAQVAFDVFKELKLKDALWTIERAQPHELVRQREELADVRRALGKWFREAQGIASREGEETRVARLQEAAIKTLAPQLRKAKLKRMELQGRKAAEVVVPLAVTAAVSHWASVPGLEDSVQAGAAGLFTWAAGKIRPRSRSHPAQANVAWSFYRLRQAIEKAG